MIHNITKTIELPTNKLRVFVIESPDEAKQIAQEKEAYLWIIKSLIYLFVVEG